jgi:hypothetical protein
MHACALFLVQFAAPTFASITWSVSEDESARRLAVATGASHTNTDDPNCIVGGYDVDNPALVYVGGPCSALKDGKPSPEFKYVKMYTADARIVDKTGTEADFKPLDETGNQHTKDLKTHLEVGVSQKVRVKTEEYKNAALFLSTTSYLSKGEFSFNKNVFVTGETEELELCVAQCCKSPGNDGCDCAGQCPTDANIDVKAGTYKYSLMAASFDNNDGHVAGTVGNGWEGVRERYGTVGAGNTTKQLEGDLDVFQIIDFANMGSGSKVTVTPPSGPSAAWSSMTSCDLTTGGGCPEKAIYKVSSVTVSADGDKWEGTYAFPLTFNRGTWSADGANKYTATPTYTKTVEIFAVKPNVATILDMELAATTKDAEAMKLLFIMYRFDISGVTATLASGTYMVYDPDVKTTAANGQKTSASTTKAAAVSTAWRPSWAAQALVLVAVLLSLRN